jgi:hypothetical protein
MALFPFPESIAKLAALCNQLCAFGKIIQVVPRGAEDNLKNGGKGLGYSFLKVELSFQL